MARALSYFLTHYNLAFFLIFACSILLALLATPLIRALALRFGAIDHPDARKVHSVPIPRLGGVAIYFAFWVVVLAAYRGFYLVRPGNINPTVILDQLLATALAGSVIALVGFLDDRKGGKLPPRAKIMAQVIASCILIYAGIHLRVSGVWWLDAALTVFWVVGMSNALNLLDNMDGLSAGTAAIAAFFFFIIAILNGQVLVATLSLALAGSCLGFLRYNYRGATIFMGDTGSLFLGFFLAVLGMKLRAQNVGGEFTFALAVLVLALPIFDTSLVTVHRFLTGRRISQGGKDHTSHRLVSLGLNPGQAVLVLYCVSFGVGAVALALANMGNSFIMLLGIPVGAFALLAGLLLARVRT